MKFSRLFSEFLLPESFILWSSSNTFSLSVDSDWLSDCLTSSLKKNANKLIYVGRMIDVIVLFLFDPSFTFSIAFWICWWNPLFRCSGLMSFFWASHHRSCWSFCPFPSQSCSDWGFPRRNSFHPFFFVLKLLKRKGKNLNTITVFFTKGIFFILFDYIGWDNLGTRKWISKWKMFYR